jgi:hypothetical protein
VCFSNYLKHNNKPVVVTWNRKFLTMIAAVTVGGGGGDVGGRGVTTLTMNIPHSTPCRE